MSRIDDFINQSDELDIQSIIDKYENKKNTSVIQNDEIWSEPLEESFSVQNDPFKKNDNKKPFNLNLDLENEDTPSDFLKNNQTIKLSNYDAPKKINLWDQDDLKTKWDKFDSVLDNNKNEANVLLTSEFQPKSRATRKLQTMKLEQLDLAYESANDISADDEIQKSKFINTQPKNSQTDAKNNFEEKYAEQYSTKILFDDNLNNIPKSELTREINDADNITIKSKKQKQVSAEKIAKMKAKQLRTEQYKSVPKFFRFEYKTSQICLWLTSIFFVATLGLLTYMAIIASMGMLDYWLLLPASICALVFGCLFTKSSLDYSYLRKDLKNSNFQIDETTPMTSIRKMYKKLLGANISLNWMCAAVYVMSGLGVLLTYIVTYFMNLTSLEFNDFTRLIIGSNNYLPVIFVWVFVGISSLALLIQITFNIINRKRRNDIELFYKNPILDELAVSKIKKNANIKGGIIFSFSLLVVGFIVLMVYFILRRKKLTKI